MKIKKFIKWLKENNFNGDLEIINNNLTVGGDLYLIGTSITELPDNLTVGGDLYLEGTNITELPNNLTVGGSLYLRGTSITELPDNLMVNGNIYGFNGDNLISLKKVSKGYNKERNYIYLDGILWGNVKSIKKRENITIYKTPLGYCVTEDKLSAHGETLKEAIDDLTYKKLKSEEVGKIVEEIKKTGKVTKAQYRAITGACQFGVNQFCEKHNITVEEIELEELKKILIDDYGAKKFWELIEEE